MEARLNLDGNPIKPTTICIIGAGGFIGSHLCEKIMAETPHTILAVDVYNDKIKHLLEHPMSGQPHLWAGRIQFHRLNIKKDSMLENLIKMSDLTINLAAICTPADYNTRPLDTIYSNFMDALPVVRYCSENDKRLIHFSTCEVYGKTIGSYLRKDHPLRKEDSAEEPAFDNGSRDDNISVDEEKFPSTVLASLQSYKKALENNDLAKIAETEAFLQSIEAEKNSLANKVTALSGDFDNFRKRTERERAKVVESLLPVLDSFERAKVQIKSETEGEEKTNSIYQSIYKQFLEILSSLGVKPIETLGNPFDPMEPEFYVLKEDASPCILGPIQKQRWCYACAKQLIERLIYAEGAENGLEYTIVRPFNWIGPRMDFIPGVDGPSEGVPRVLACFSNNLLRREPLKLVDGGQSQRTFVYINDAIKAVLLMIENPDRANGHIFNVGNPDNEVTVKQLAEIMTEVYCKVSGEPPIEVPTIDISSKEFYGEGYDDSDRRIPDMTIINRQLGWNPRTPLHDLLDSTLTYQHKTYAEAIKRVMDR